METSEIKKIMAAGIVEFDYMKKDGTIRHAKGTRNADVIKNNNATPAGAKRAASNSVIAYFDLISNGWRSFNVCNFIGFVKTI